MHLLILLDFSMSSLCSDFFASFANVRSVNKDTKGCSVLLLCTVVKREHTEGIEREKTSSQKFTVIALDF